MIPNDRVLPALLRRDFSLFLRFANRELQGAKTRSSGIFRLNAMIHRPGNRWRARRDQRLIVTMPPRHLKSVTMTAWSGVDARQEPRAAFHRRQLRAGSC